MPPDRRDLIDLLQRFMLEDPGLVISRMQAYWNTAAPQLRDALSTSEWSAVERLMDMINRYEPNPQFCNRSAGMVDGWDVRQAVKELLLGFHAAG